MDNGEIKPKRNIKRKKFADEEGYVLPKKANNSKKNSIAASERNEDVVHNGEKTAVENGEIPVVDGETNGVVENKYTAIVETKKTVKAKKKNAIVENGRCETPESKKSSVTENKKTAATGNKKNAVEENKKRGVESKVNGVTDSKKTRASKEKKPAAYEDKETELSEDERNEVSDSKITEASENKKAKVSAYKKTPLSEKKKTASSENKKTTFSEKRKSAVSASRKSTTADAKKATVSENKKISVSENKRNSVAGNKKQIEEKKNSVATKKKNASEEKAVPPKRKSDASKAQICQKNGCTAPSLVCFVNASETCAKDGHSSRWYHMSELEHFCNDCYDYYYRTRKEGFKLYEPWKAHWGACCRKEAKVKIFIGEEILPYWAQCNSCEKWRQLDKSVTLDWEMSQRFKCKDISGVTCKTAERQFVKEAKDPLWTRLIACPPYLKESPAAPFLRDFYYDGIGLSPPTNPLEESKEQFAENMIPFYSAEDSEKARCICAEVMTDEEKKWFPHYVKYTSVFLGLRNLVMSLWSIDPKKYLTYKSCIHYVVCRGSGRITLSEELKRVLDFLTISGYINFGILPRVPEHFNLSYWKGTVLVIGAGIAGVGAARQLKNAGCQVKVLEASDRCGGRTKDDHSLGNCIGLGAQIITGCINNPLFVMCKQAGIALRYLGMRCDLIDDNGAMIENSVDQEVEFRFNLMLDSLEEWKQSINKREHECFSLSEALAEQLKELQKSLCKNMSQVEKDLLQFHLGNLEYGCGSSLQNVSAVHWNQNEEFPQYSGAHAWAVDGFESIVQKLAEDLTILYNSQVTSVDSTAKIVKVKTKSGETFYADKVISTLPLSIYQSKFIDFNPQLPPEKQRSIDRLGAGIIEKIALKFPRPFWRKKIGEADYFGHVPSSVKDRGLFSVFYDVSKGKNYILMTVVAGEAVKQKAEMTDEELVQKCMKTLKNIFREEKVPKPSSFVVSHWATDPTVKMAYSFAKVGSSGKDYDIIAEPVGDKLYFAGEATNRQFPQTVTGAYLSGLREARNILGAGT